jgi:hypothetical protein
MSAIPSFCQRKLSDNLNGWVTWQCEGAAVWTQTRYARMN